MSPRKNPNDPSLFSLITEIGIIEQLSRNQLERSLPDGLKVSQFALLNHLTRLGGEWSPARLASAFQVTKGAMTNTVGRLEKRGLVQVLPDPGDGRGKLVSITDSGKKALTRCIESVGPFLGELSEEVSAKEIKSILPVLERIRKYLDEHR